MNKFEQFLLLMLSLLILLASIFVGISSANANVLKSTYKSYMDLDYLHKRFGKGQGKVIAVVDTARDPKNINHYFQILTTIGRVAPYADIQFYDYLSEDLYFQQDKVLLQILNKVKAGEKIDIICCAWVMGTASDEWLAYFKDIIKQLHDRGVIIVVASGNNGAIDDREFYPALWSEEGLVYSVGAYHNRKTKEQSSFTSTPFNLLAPSCVRLNKRTRYVCGTSISAAWVSGLFGLGLDIDQIKNYLAGIPIEPIVDP